MKPVQKLLLAVDAFAEDPEGSAEKVVRSVRGLIGEGTRIEAVYVMTPDGVNLPVEDFSEYQDYYATVATAVLQNVLSECDDLAPTSVTVLPQGTNSVRAAAKTLLAHVERTGADLIAVSTHARKGADRFFIGSFAETLMLRSSVPLLVSNPSAPWDPAYRHILFATDFSASSNEAFEAVISLARQISAEVTVFHRVDPESPFLPPPGFIAVREWRERKLDRQAKALRLKERAEKSGIRVNVDIDLKNHRVVPAILEAAERLKVSLIAIAARPSSDLAAMGSTPRRIARHAPCPVWILPSRKAAHQEPV